MGAKGYWSKATVAEMLRLVHRLHESRSGGGAARRRALLEGLCALVEGAVGFMVLGQVDENGTWGGASATHVHGMDGQAGETLVKTVAVEDGRADPAFGAILARVVKRGEETPLTATRRELVDDDDWYASPHVKEIRKKAGIDDGVYSAQLLGARVVACVCLARPWWEKRRFDRAERELVDLLHGQCAWVYREEIPPAEIQALPLSPREKQTLWKLLSGRGEKQIAAEMDLSRNTVHDYVKSLYKHFRVSSRAELLAKWVEREG